jgi:hypothetical protein
MPKIIIHLRDGIDEKRLMEHLTCIIEGDSCHGDHLPQIVDGGVPRTWRLDSLNDWAASLTRRGEAGFSAEDPKSAHDTLTVTHRYYPEGVEALRPWLEYQFGRRGLD